MVLYVSSTLASEEQRPEQHNTTSLSTFTSAIVISIALLSVSDYILLILKRNL